MIDSFEALIRWNHPDGFIVSPAEFISLAEKTMLILPIGNWVIREACFWIKSWHASGMANLSVSVNVSAIQFQQKGFAESVIYILKTTNTAPECIELEITESSEIELIDVTAENVAILKSNGVRVSMDDFGSGHCAFNYLKYLKPDSVKIDKSFISNPITNPNSRIDDAIIDSIILLCKSLGLSTTAEGIETPEQLDYITEKGCDKAQGFYFSKPLSGGDVLSWLQGK
jgi:EAL domain-containing protein (putative c-di-GMP-specific phosphodiesterase class I)